MIWFNSAVRAEQNMYNSITKQICHIGNLDINFCGNYNDGHISCHSAFPETDMKWLTRLQINLCMSLKIIITFKTENAYGVQFEDVGICLIHNTCVKITGFAGVLRVCQTVLPHGIVCCWLLVSAQSARNHLRPLSIRSNFWIGFAMLKSVHSPVGPENWHST